MSARAKTETDQRGQGIFPAPMSLAVKATTFSVSESDLRMLEKPITYNLSEGPTGRLFPTSALYSLYQATIQIGHRGFASIGEIGLKAKRFGDVGEQAIQKAMETLSQLEQPLVAVLVPGTQQTQLWAITNKGREVVRAIRDNTEGIRFAAIAQGDLSFRSLLKALGGVEFSQANLVPPSGTEALRKRAQV